MEGNNDWIKHLMEQDLSRDEKEGILKNLNDTDRELYAKLERIKAESSEFQPPKAKSKDEAWSAIMERVANESIRPTTKVVPFYQNPTFVSWVAASVAIMVGVYFFFNYFGEKHFYVPNSHMEAVVFPDSSKATVNSHSRLKYNKRNFYKDRRVELHGEAFFEIEEGEPFEVETKAGAVFVLGTQFNVLSRDNEFQVKCLSGKVKVVLQDISHSIELNPGQATRLKERRLTEPYTVKRDQIGAWQDGLFYFESDPLILVIEELERQFDVQVKAENISGRTYSGHFSNDNIEEALKLVFEPMNLKYDIIDKRLIMVR